jgi:hypothetical protein
MRVGLSALVLALGVAAGACSVLGPEAPGSPTSPPLTSGIRGTVLIGPTCEEATRASPCTEPYAARLIVLDAEGGYVDETTSDETGRFQILLPPGTYTIQPEPGGEHFPIARPIAVEVVPDVFVEVGIDYDTGIR